MSTRYSNRRSPAKALTVSAGVAVAALWLSLSATGAGAASGANAGSGQVCQWGGTPAQTSGRVTIKPGTTNTPSSGPLSFRAWGPLVGGGPCHGQTMTFRGTLDKGASCFTQVFRGRVEGLPGVSRFYGPGVLGQVQEFLYDEAGNVVGSDQPQVLTSSTDLGDPAFMHCNTPEGVTHLEFSSSVELYGGAQSESARTGRSGGAQTFKGSCQFNGNVSFDPPLGAVSRETTVTAKAPGHCSGSLTGASGRTVELDQAPARYSAVSLGPQPRGRHP